LTLRRVFKQRHDRLTLTVNDLLILYRAIHAATYQPKAELVTALNDLSYDEPTRPAARAALEAMDGAHQLNPAMVIPVDGSRRNF
jgi:hypothetical protein